MSTHEEALSLVQQLSPGEPVQWWEAPALLEHHLEGTPGTHEDFSTSINGTDAQKGFKFLIFSYQDNPSVILKAEDWKALIRQLEMLARFHVAFGSESTLPLQQVKQLVHYVPFEGTYWAILPLQAWKNLFQKLEECYHPAEWQSLTDGLRWLQDH